MTVQDNYLQEVAKAANGESFSRPAFHGVTDDSSFTVTTAISDLIGEIGSRNSVTSSRNSLTVTHNSLRVGASDVVDTTNGDELHGAALAKESSGDFYFVAAELPGTLHTQNFDLEFDYEVTFSRSG